MALTSASYPADLSAVSDNLILLMDFCKPGLVLRQDKQEGSSRVHGSSTSVVAATGAMLIGRSYVCLQPHCSSSFHPNGNECRLSCNAFLRATCDAGFALSVVKLSKMLLQRRCSLTMPADLQRSMDSAAARVLRVATLHLFLHEHFPRAFNIQAVSPPRCQAKTTLSCRLSEDRQWPR